MQYFPIFLTGNRIKALVVGGGEVAARKLDLLLKTEAQISVLAPAVCQSVSSLIDKHAIQWIKTSYETGHMSNANLVIAATDSTKTNRSIAVEAEQHGILINVVDQPSLCSYITPAIIDRDPMLVALCSSGKSPILLRMLRENIEKSLPEKYGELANFSGDHRERIQRHFTLLTDRRKFWESALTGEIGAAVIEGNQTKAENLLTASLENSQRLSKGQLTYITTNNDDPDNLTLKAHRAMQFVDRLYIHPEVSARFIEYVRRDATKSPYNNDVKIDTLVKYTEQGENILCLVPSSFNLSEVSAFDDLVVIHSGS